MKHAPADSTWPADRDYLERCLAIFVDEISRRRASGEAATLRLGVKVAAGVVESIKLFIEDDFSR